MLIPKGVIDMKLDLKRVLDTEGAEIAVNETLDLTGYELWDSKPFIKPVEVVGKVYNHCDITMLEYTAKYPISCRCARCNKPIVQETEQSYSYTVVRSLACEDNSDGYIVVDNDTLLLDELVFSDILLGLPLKILCSEDCKGLCSVCGHDLNESDCGCVQQTVDPRLTALADLLKNDKNN